MQEANSNDPKTRGVLGVPFLAALRRKQQISVLFILNSIIVTSIVKDQNQLLRFN